MKRSVVLLIAGATLAACGSSEVAPADTTTSVVCVMRGATVTPASATLRLGDTLRAKAENNTCGGRLPVGTFMWKSGNPAVATVDSAGGLITARGTGTTTIRATSLEDVTQSTSLVLQVIP